MNTESLKNLRLSPEKISRDMGISIGLARAYERRAKEEDGYKTNAFPIAATYFRRSAANALLLGHYDNAKGLFLEATSIYQTLGLPYSVVVGALSSEGRSITERLTHDWLRSYALHEIPDSAVHQVAYAILAQLVSIESRQMLLALIRIRRELDPYRLRPLGVLGVSVGTLLDIFDSLVPNADSRTIDLTEATAPIFGAYNAAIRHAMENSYHWERLALPFHPAEPDVYGVLTLIDAILQERRNFTLPRLIEQSPISRECKYLLNTILDGISGNQQENTHRL